MMRKESHLENLDKKQLVTIILGLEEVSRLWADSAVISVQMARSFAYGTDANCRLKELEVALEKMKVLNLQMFDGLKVLLSKHH